eukprot:Clim_evm6s14 gene=Clim_evmTU6s14
MVSGDNNSPYGRRRLNSSSRRDDEEVLVPFWVKSFAAGFLLAKVNKALMGGVMLGIVSGMYIEQNFRIPDIAETYNDLEHATFQSSKPFIDGIKEVIAEADKKRFLRKPIYPGSNEPSAIQQLSSLFGNLFSGTAGTASAPDVANSEPDDDE